MIPNLIYDIGMHDGSDSEFYLRKGYRVVAVEANPKLVEACRERLAP
jgi:spermidine synthase